MPEVEYEGLPIRKNSLAVRGASGDALSGVLKVRPQDFTPGVPVYVLMEVMPGPVRHDPMDDGEAWEHIQITKAQRGTIINADVALPYLDEVTIALEDLRVRETGQERLPLEDDPLIVEHEVGMHKRKRRACRLCNPTTDQEHAMADEVAAQRAKHGDGEGDDENPVPPSRTHRTRARGAAKKAGGRRK
jgi:hypothetical protein